MKSFATILKTLTNYSEQFCRLTAADRPKWIQDSTALQVGKLGVIVFMQYIWTIERRNNISVSQFEVEAIVYSADTRGMRLHSR